MNIQYQKAIEYFKNNIDTVNTVSNLFNVNRKTLTKYLKELGINTSKITVYKFIAQSNKIHENKYDYSLITDFNSVKDKVKIICPVHGVFEQDIYSHKKGCGCPTCARKLVGSKKLKSKSDFLNQVFKIHGNLYNYDKTIIVNNNVKIIITCRVHGDFLQTPDKHKQGQGCPCCAEENKGWSKSNWKKLIRSSDTPKLYIIRCYNNDENFIKIGRTKNTLIKRFSTKSSLPYNYEILKIIESDDSDEIFELEVKLKREFIKYKYKPLIYFAGNTECFKVSIKNKLLAIV
jgi:hypothetical protein